MVFGIMDLFAGSDGAPVVLPFFFPIGLLGAYRLLLFVIRLTGYLLYRPIKPSISRANVFSASDVTIIVPTIDAGPEFINAAKQWLKNNPAEIIVVTTHALRHDIEMAISHLGKIRVLSVPHPNKRVQLIEGVNAASTDILAFSDDDAIWSDDFLKWSLAPFDDERCGGVGSSQAMIPCGEKATIWEILADMRLSMRMMEASASTKFDGGISCLSGRTALYRREIVADVEFQEKFTNEKWMGKYQLHSGDDKFLTRWLVKNNWGMHLQMHDDAMLLTTFKPNWMFLKQLLRWTRNTWRSDFTSLFIDRAIWRRYPYVAFNMLDKMFNPISMLLGPIFIIHAMLTHPHWSWIAILATEVTWIFFSRYMRLIEHWRRREWDIFYLPTYIAFNYLFAFMKVYALFTLHITGWQTRSDVGNDVDAHELSNLSLSITIDAEAVDTVDTKTPITRFVKHGVDKVLDEDIGDRPQIVIHADPTVGPARAA